MESVVRLRRWVSRAGGGASLTPVMGWSQRTVLVTVLSDCTCRTVK